MWLLAYDRGNANVPSLFTVDTSYSGTVTRVGKFPAPQSFGLPVGCMMGAGPDYLIALLGTGFSKPVIATLNPKTMQPICNSTPPVWPTPSQPQSFIFI